MLGLLLLICVVKKRVRRVKVNETKHKPNTKLNPVALFMEAEEKLDLKPQEVVSEMTNILNSNEGESEKENAYRLRAHAYVQLGKYDLAKADSKHIEDAEIESLISSGETLLAKLKTEQGFNQRLELLSSLFEISPQSAFVYEQRAKMALEQDDLDGYLKLSREALFFDPGNAKLFMERAKLLFCAGYSKEALNSLRLYTNNQKVRAERHELQRVIIGFKENLSYVTSKKESGKISAALQSLDNCNKSCMKYCKESDDIVIQLGMAKAMLLEQQGDKKGCVGLLTYLISLNSGVSGLYVSRGQIYVDDGECELAISDFTSALNIDPMNPAARQGLRNAKLKQRREQSGGDLYKVLGLTSDCSMADIREAFKKKTKEWHPDQFTDSEKKKEAEEKMKQINQAYETLQDERSRAEYDMGQENGEYEEWGGGGMPFFFPFADILKLFEAPLQPQRIEIQDEGEFDPFHFFENIE